MEKDEGKVSSEKKKFDLKKLKKKDFFLLFLAGILLVFITVPDMFFKKKEASPTKETDTNHSIINAATTKETEEEEYITKYENKLKKLLEQMEGVGKVDVMITLKSSREQIVLKDIPYTQESLNETDKEGGSRISSSSQNEEETVLITTKAGETVPYVTKEIEASVEGVVVLAQGGGDGRIASKIVSAVEVLFDVPAHKVQVLPMINK